MEPKRLSVKERLEYVWRRRKPDPETGTEVTADGLEVPIPSRDEYLANLKKLAKPKKG